MNNTAVCDLVSMTIIAGRKIKGPLLESLKNNGGKLVNVEYGYGSTYVNSFSEIFGFKPENKKVVIICVMKREDSIKMLEILDRDFYFDKPNTGIAYTIALSELSF